MAPTYRNAVQRPTGRLRVNVYAVSCQSCWEIVPISSSHCVRDRDTLDRSPVHHRDT